MKGALPAATLSLAMQTDTTTEGLKEALGLMYIRVIDHVVMESDGCKPFAEMGFL